MSLAGTLRARGYVAGGSYDASSWFVEAYSGAPAFITLPASRTNDIGTSATFSVLVGSTESFGYQWFKNGVTLMDGGNIAGARTFTLVVSNAFGGDAGGHTVVVSNAQGSVTSLVATLTVVDPGITVQPASQNREPGQSVTLSVTTVGTPPLSYQWWKDGVVMSSSTAPSLILTNLQASDAGLYAVVVSNIYGTVTSAAALLTVNLATPDSTFNPGDVGGGGGTVSLVAVQTDGKILVGGSFTTFAGQAHNGIGRLNPDGTLDSAFNPGANGELFALVAQADGKILVGGGFTMLGGQTHNRIGRLNADGTLDNTFNPGADSAVFSLAVQADGKILVGGEFDTLGGQTRNGIGRLNADGTLDSSFNPGAGGDYSGDPGLGPLVVQVDGKILVGGDFTTLGGQPRNGVGRLNADGTLDLTFNPQTGGDYPYPNYAPVASLVVQADGKILVGGTFTARGGGRGTALRG